MTLQNTGHTLHPVLNEQEACHKEREIDNSFNKRKLQILEPESKEGIRAWIPDFFGYQFPTDPLRNRPCSFGAPRWMKMLAKKQRAESIPLLFSKEIMEESNKSLVIEGFIKVGGKTETKGFFLQVP